MSDLLTEVVDGVGVMTLNRPDRLNAISDDMVAAMATTLSMWDDDDGVGAIVLRGAGKAFCAGGDLVDFAADGGINHGSTVPDPARVAWLRDVQRGSVGALTACRKPTIAAVTGAAAGAGMGIALACDLRVGSEKSLFTTAFTGVGLSGDFGVTWLLTHIVGRARARQMLMLSEQIAGEQALSWGLLNWLVEPDELMDWTMTFARQLADGPRFALQQVKRNLAHADVHDLLTSMDFEAETQIESGAAADHREAVTAFLARRTSPR